MNDAGPPQVVRAPLGLMPAAPSLPAQGGTGRRVVASGIGLYSEAHAMASPGTIGRSGRKGAYP
jgi:hypothetical protein